VYQGNDLIWLPFPSDSTNELQDASYPYTPEFAVELSRMHAGQYDVQKIVKKIKLQTDELEVDTATGKPICWFELDYKLNEDEDWITIPDIFNSSPTQEVDFTSIFGISGKRLKFRLRGYTRDSSKTPVFLAIIISAVIIVDNKFFYGPYTVKVEDDEKVKGAREVDSEYTAAQKRQILKDWSDASNDSMILLNSVASLCDNKMIFMNYAGAKQIGFKNLKGSPYTSDVYLVDVSFQEA